MNNYIPEVLPKGTTREQWERYAEEMERHEAHYRNSEPQKKDYETERAFDKAYGEWQMNRSCFEPNAPGYYRANND